jgi:hypothetical protein
MRGLCRLAGLVAVMALGGAGWGSGAEAPSARIPAGPDAPTVAGLHALLEAYYTRNMVEAYQTAGTKGKRWGEAAVAFLEESARCQSGVGRIPPQALAAQGKALVDQGCTDPMVLYGYGAALEDSEGRAQAAPILQQALDGLAKSTYARMFCIMALARLARTAPPVTTPEATQQYAAYREQMIRFIGEGAADASYRQGGQRLFLFFMRGIWDGPLSIGEQELYETLNANPKTDPYVLGVTRGWYELALAMEAWVEGEGADPDVAEECQARYRSHLTAARDSLIEAWRLHPEFPEAPTEMIAVATDPPDGVPAEAKQWFYRAVTAQLDYMRAYEDILSSLGHNRDALYAFGVECLETRRFDTQIPLLLIDVLRGLDDDGDNTYWLKPETHQYLEQLFTGYTAYLDRGKGREDSYTALESLHAAMDYLTRHYEETQSRLAKLGEGVNQEVFESCAGSTEGALRVIEAHSAKPAPAPAERGAEHPPSPEN